MAGRPRQRLDDLRRRRWTTVNAEPAKCAGLTWGAPDQLPAHTVPYNAAGIAAYLRGTPHATGGWAR